MASPAALSFFLLAGLAALPAPEHRPITRETLEETIKPWLGTPYKYGSTDRRRGTDCSGFVVGVAQEAFEVDLPHSSREQFKLGKAVKRARLEPGDLVFFATGQKDSINHVGIYMGEGKFAHASRTRGVVYDELREYGKSYRGARRVWRLQ